jgi:hypothetical protein
MSEKAFEWKLTPTERRIAEAAYADSEGGAWRAVQKIMHLRGERGPWDDGLSLAMNDALLDELRREPSWSLDSQAMDSLLLSGYRARKLLERALEKSIDDQWLAEAREVLKP